MSKQNTYLSKGVRVLLQKYFVLHCTCRFFKLTALMLEYFKSINWFVIEGFTGLKVRLTSSIKSINEDEEEEKESYFNENSSKKKRERERKGWRKLFNINKSAKIKNCK